LCEPTTGQSTSHGVLGVRYRAPERLASGWLVQHVGTEDRDRHAMPRIAAVRDLDGRRADPEIDAVLGHQGEARATGRQLREPRLAGATVIRAEPPVHSQVRPQGCTAVELDHEVLAVRRRS
jgi:hypothetical protein